MLLLPAVQLLKPNGSPSKTQQQLWATNTTHADAITCMVWQLCQQNLPHLETCTCTQCGPSSTQHNTQPHRCTPTQFVPCMAHAGPMQHITSPPDPHAWQLHPHRLPNLAMCTCTQYGPSHTQHNTHTDIMAAPLSL